MLYPLTRALLRAAACVLWRLEVTGAEHVPSRGAVIVASNHQAFVDSVLIPMVLPRRVVFLAKREYFETPGPRGRAMAFFFRSIGAVPVTRDGSRDALDALEVAQAVLRAGDAFGIYPEGTRSRDGRLYRGRTGVAWLALATRSPVVPVALAGTDRAQPGGGGMIRPAKVRVRFGPPVDPVPLADLVAAGHLGPGRARRDLTDTVMSAIADMSPQPLADGYNTPPADETPHPV